MELRRVLAPGGWAWVYELRREASIRDLRAFARETGLPFFLVHLGYKIVSRHHALREKEFAQLLRQAAGSYAYENYENYETCETLHPGAPHFLAGRTPAGLTLRPPPIQTPRP